MAELAEALRELQRAWSQQRAPIVEILAPPATGEQIKLVEQTIQKSLHSSLRTLWGWHNGLAQPGSVGVHSVGPAGYLLLSCQESVRHHRSWTESAEQVSADEEIPVDQLWQQTWVPIARTSDAVLIVDNTTGAIRKVRWHEGTQRRIAAGTLLEVVDLWAQLLREGFWRWDNDAWSRDAEWRDYAARYPHLF